MSTRHKKKSRTSYNYKNKSFLSASVNSVVMSDAEQTKEFEKKVASIHNILKPHIAKKVSYHLMTNSGQLDAINARMSNIIQPREKLIHLESNVDNYIFQETLGLGGFCEVKKATHKFSNQIVAVKVMDKDKLEQQEDHDR